MIDPRDPTTAALGGVCVCVCVCVRVCENVDELFLSYLVWRVMVVIRSHHKYHKAHNAHSAHSAHSTHSTRHTLVLCMYLYFHDDMIDLLIDHGFYPSDVPQLLLQEGADAIEYIP